MRSIRAMRAAEALVSPMDDSATSPEAGTHRRATRRLKHGIKKS